MKMNSITTDSFEMVSSKSYDFIKTIEICSIDGNYTAPWDYRDLWNKNFLNWSHPESRKFTNR